MSGISLVARLSECETVLKNTHAHIEKHDSKILTRMTASQIKNKLVEISGKHSRIEEIIKLIGSRDSIMKIMQNLHKSAIPMPAYHVKLCDNVIHYKDARLLVVQGYMNTVWAIADNITDIAGRIACSYSLDRTNPWSAKLVSTFVAKTKEKDGSQTAYPTSALLNASLKDGFGWPIVLSYVIRNIFAHEGGMTPKGCFFDEDTISSGFRIKDLAWEHILEQANNKGFDKSMTRAPEDWPWPKAQDDLRELLLICNREMDDALGILLRSACDAFKSHVAYLYGAK